VFFFPYRADIELHRWPLLTLLLVVSCLSIFFLQLNNQINMERATRAFCEDKQPRSFRLAAKAVFGSASPRRCIEILFGMHTAKDRDAFVENKVANARTLAGFDAAGSAAYLNRAFSENYRRFTVTVPSYLTQSLWYYPDSWNVLRMLTAAMAHGSWAHVLGNLIFLFAFAATLEMLLGGLIYAVVLVALAVLSHSVYSVATIATQDALPTIGLSGVVYGVMGLFTFFLPTTKIRCFAWLVVFFKRFSIPAWTLVGGFVGLDVYHLFWRQDGSTTNFAAHIGGAAFGYLIGVVFFRAKRVQVRAILAEGSIEDTEDLNGNEEPARSGHWSDNKKRKW
jgi:membrane associated rhomboid family serine protease